MTQPVTSHSLTTVQTILNAVNTLAQQRELDCHVSGRSLDVHLENGPVLVVCFATKNGVRVEMTSSDDEYVFEVDPSDPTVAETILSEAEVLVHTIPPNRARPGRPGRAVRRAAVNYTLTGTPTVGDPPEWQATGTTVVQKARPTTSPPSSETPAEPVSPPHVRVPSSGPETKKWPQAGNT